MCSRVKVGDRIGKLIGAPEGTVVMGDTLSIKVYQALFLALALEPLDDADPFGYGQLPVRPLHGPGAWSRCRVTAMSSPSSSRGGRDAIDERIAVLMLTEVDYRTGRLHDMRALTAKAHVRPAQSPCGTSPTPQVLPVDVTGANADFAIGCTCCAISTAARRAGFHLCRAQHADKARPALSGWMGHEAPFASTSITGPATASSACVAARCR